MVGWNAGYVTDVTYTHGYYRELHPRFLALCALNRSVLVPGLGAGRLRVLELGCGQGLAANLIAAANPEIDYLAVDFMPQHVVGARALATAAGSTNIRFSGAGFEALAAEPASEDFDVITLHGVFSWVSAPVRAQIVEIARRRLKPGGLLYLSYNTHPGWSAFLPVRRLLHDAAAALPRASLAEQLDAAFQLLRRLRETDARFLAATPDLARHMADLESQKHSYLAHEYLNADWEVFHVEDVMAQLAEAKLGFLGSAHPIEQIDRLNLTEAQIALLAETPNPGRREALRDLLVNRAFRRDIFIKGAVTQPDDVLRPVWMRLRFVLTRPRALVPDAVDTPMGRAALDNALHGALLDALATGPLDLASLLRLAGLEARDWGALRQAIMVLAGAGHIQLCAPAEAASDRSARCETFNMAVLDQARFGEDLRYLASPVSGAEVAMDRFSQLLMRARRRGEADPPASVAAFMEEHGQRLMSDGQTLSTAPEMAHALRRHQAESFVPMLPVWTILGIA